MLPDRPSSPLPLGLLWRRFAEKADALGMGIRTVADERVAGAVLSQEAPGARFTTEAAQRYPTLVGGAPLPIEPKQPYPSIVASARFAVAESGSLALAAPPVERGACFLAEHLWLVVRRADIVPTLDVALEHIAEAVRTGDPYITLMSGPSRTADIERVLTIGVHGPRRLTVLVIERG